MAMVFLENMALLIISVIFVGLPMSIRWPIYNSVQNQFIPDSVRATTFSLLSIFDSLLDILVLGIISFYTTDYLLVVFGACLVITTIGLLFAFRENE